MTSMSDLVPRVATQVTWDVAVRLRSDALVWLNSARVDLDRDPTKNIGGLHAKVAEVRQWANKVRDLLFQVQLVTMQLRRESSQANVAYEARLSEAIRHKTDDAVLKQFKSKEERELFFRQGFQECYDQKVTAEQRLEEYEAFQKAVNLIYYSLSNTRDDVGTQVAVLKQQMFSGEIKPNPELGKFNSLADFLGEGARSLFGGSGAFTEEPSTAPAGGDGETPW